MYFDFLGSGWDSRLHRPGLLLFVPEEYYYPETAAPDQPVFQVLREIPAGYLAVSLFFFPLLPIVP